MPDTDKIQKNEDGLPILKKGQTVNDDGLPVLKKKEETSNLAVSPSGSLETNPKPAKPSTPSESESPSSETIFDTIFGNAPKKEKPVNKKQDFVQAPSAEEISDSKGTLLNEAEENVTKNTLVPAEKAKVHARIVNLRNNFFNGTMTPEDVEMIPGDLNGMSSMKAAEAINNKTKNLKIWGNISVMRGLNHADLDLQIVSKDLEFAKQKSGDNTEEVRNLENKRAFLLNSITNVYNAEADKTTGELASTLKNSLDGPIKYDPYTNTVDEKSQFYIRKQVDDYLNTHHNDVINYKTSGNTKEGERNYPDIANRVINYFNTVIPVQKAHDQVYKDIVTKYPQAKGLIDHIGELNEHFSKDQVDKADAYIKTYQDKSFLGVQDRYFGKTGQLSSNPEFIKLEEKYKSVVDKGEMSEEAANQQITSEIGQNKELKRIYDNYTKSVDSVQTQAKKMWEDYMINGLKRVDPSLTMYKNGNVGIEGMNQADSKKILDEYSDELAKSTAKTLHDQSVKLGHNADERANHQGAFWGSFGDSMIGMGEAFSKYVFDKTGWGGQNVEMFQANRGTSIPVTQSDEAKKWNWAGMKSLKDFNFYASGLGSSLPLFGGAAAVTAASKGAGLPEYVSWMAAAGMFDASASLENYNNISVNGRDKYGNKLTEHDAAIAAADQFKESFLPDMMFAAANLGILSRAKNIVKPTLLKSIGTGVKGVTVGAIPMVWQGYAQYATALEAEGKKPDIWDYAQDGKLASSLIQGIAGGAFLQLAHIPGDHIQQTENWKRMMYTSSGEFYNNSMFNVGLNHEISGMGNQWRDALKNSIATVEMTPQEKEDQKNTLLYSTLLEKNIKGGGIDISNVTGAYQAHSLALADLHEQWSKENEGTNLGKIYSEQAGDFRKDAKNVMEGKGKFHYLSDVTDQPIFISDQSFKVLDADGKIAEWIKSGTIEGIHSSEDPNFDATYKEKIKSGKSPDVEAVPVKEAVIEPNDQTKIINALKDHAEDISGVFKLSVDGSIGDPKKYESLTKEVISQAIDHPTLTKEMLGKNIWNKIEPIVSEQKKISETEAKEKENAAQKNEATSGPEEKKEQTRQGKVNDLVDLKQKYNSLRKNDPQKAEMLNKIKLNAEELGLTVKDTRGFAEVLTSGNKDVQKRFEGNKAETKNFDPKDYDPKTVQLVSDLAKNDAYLTGLNIVGGDGRSMSEKQKASALEDVRNGKNTVGSKAVHDALDDMVKSGMIEIKDPASGQKVGVPVEEFMKIQNSEDELSPEEAHEMLAGQALTDEEFNHLQNYINDEQSAEGGMVQEPNTGKTEESEKGAVSGKKAEGAGSETPAANRVKGIVSGARALADKIRNADITGAGGTAARSDISSIPREVLATAIDGFASALEVGAKVVDALKQAIQFIKDNSEFTDDKKLEDYLRGQLAAEVPELGSDFDKDNSKGSTVSSDTPPKLFGEDPKILKTGGGFKSTFVRNFERLASLEKALGTEQEALKAAYKASSSEGTAKGVLVKIAREMKKTFGDKANQVYTDMRKMLVQSNLNGRRERWNDWSQHIGNATTEDIQKWATDPTFAEKNGLPKIDFITDTMENNPHFRGMTRSANELIQRNNYDGLKDFMSINFNRAAQMVQQLDWSTGKSYEEMRKDPDIQKAKGIYYQEFGSKVAAAQQALGGAMNTFLGEEGVYYPLVSVSPEEDQIKQKFFQKKNPLAKSSTPYNDFSSGLGNQYDLTVAGLQDRITSAYKARDKNSMIETFKTEGYMVPFEKGAKEDVINISGNYVPAVKININEGSNLRPANYLVPTGVEKDIRAIINTGKDNLSTQDLKDKINKITGFINKTTLSTPIEALRHTTNLLFRINKNTPYAFNNLAGKTIGAVPIVKQIMQLGHLAFMDPTAEKWQNTLKELGEAGEIPSKYGKSSFSQNWAEMTGAEKADWWKANFSPLLYGTSGIDIRARLMMWDINKGMNPNATPNQMRTVMSSLGDYNKGLQSSVVTLLKEQTGLAPFIVSQQARLRSGIESYNLLPKYSNLPLEGLPLSKQLLYHTLNLMQASVYGYVGMWAATYLAKTGDNPFTTPGSRLGVIPGVNDSDEGPGSISLGAFYTAASVGTKVTGMDKFFQSKSEGKDNFEAMEQGLLQSMNTTAAPVASGSPVMHIASGIFGVAPYVVSVNDDRGEPSINFLPTTIPAPNKGEQIPFNVANDAIHVNPLVGAAADFTMKKTLGHDLSREPGKSAWKQSFYQNMLEGFFPGILVNDVNLKQQEYYQKRDEDVQKRAFDREEKKQEKSNE